VSGAAASGAASGAAAGGTAAGGAAGSGASGGSVAAEAAPAKASAAPQGVFGVAVGTYLDEDRANQEMTKLIASTKLPAQVLTVTEDGTSLYRLVMGSFESRQKAERSASSLIERGLVDEARVVPLSAAKK
jgi:cell division septation protein DedD